MAKRKNKDVKWYAFREEFNSNRHEHVNVLCGDFVDDLLNRIKKNEIVNYEQLKENVKRMLMYRYWSKAEHEVVVRSLFYREDRDNETKIDVWYQLEPNLDRICEYIIRELSIEF